MTHNRFKEQPIYQTNELDFGFTDKRVAITIFHKENKEVKKYGNNNNLY